MKEHPIPEAIEKHWRNEHWLYCAECGFIAKAITWSQPRYRSKFDAAWKQHLEEKHSEGKP